MKKRSILLMTLCLVGCVCITRAADEGDIEYFQNENIPSIVETGIERVESSAKQMAKTYYNLCGQRVDSAYQGIVVSKGKKFVKR